VVAWRPSASACSRASCLLPSPEHLERDFELHVLAFSRQGASQHLSHLPARGGTLSRPPRVLRIEQYSSSPFMDSVRVKETAKPQGTPLAREMVRWSETPSAAL
jgi:hypothetical protein